MGDVLSINVTPADLVRDTQHLTTAEVGAYHLILWQIVVLGQNVDPPSIPDDDQMLANITRLSLRDWRKVKPRLCSGDMAVLTLAQGRVSQVRLVYEIEEAQERIRGASKAGKASGEARRKKADIRERLLNGRSNARSTDVPTSVAIPFDASPLEQSNGTRTSHESRVTKKNQKKTGEASSSSDDADGEETIRSVLRIIAPGINVTGAALAKWRRICADPWQVAAALCEKETYLLEARSAAYVTQMLTERAKDDGFNAEDPHGYVEFRMASWNRRMGETG